jgi:hypothetical protein
LITYLALIVLPFDPTPLRKQATLNDYYKDFPGLLNDDYSSAEKNINTANEPSFLKPVPSPVPWMSPASPSGSSIYTTKDVRSEPPEQLLKNDFELFVCKSLRHTG